MTEAAAPAVKTPAVPPVETPPPGQGGPWYGAIEGVDDEMKSFYEGKGFPDLATALKSGMHADRLARDRNVWSAPDMENLGDWDGWKKLGWTEDAGAYKVERPEAAKDVSDYNQAFHDAFAAAAHKHHVPPQMAVGLLGDTVAAIQGQMQAEMASAEEEGRAAGAALDAALKEKWGADYDANLAKAEAAARTLYTRVGKSLGQDVGLDQMSRLEEALGSAPALMEMFRLVGEAIGEDTLVTGLPTGIASPAAAKAEIQRMKADPETAKALSDPRHARHGEIKERWAALHEAAAKV